MRDTQPKSIGAHLGASFAQEFLRDHGIDLAAVRIEPSTRGAEAEARERARRDEAVRISALLTRRVPAKDIELLVAPAPPGSSAPPGAGRILDTHAITAVRRWLADDNAPRLLVLEGPKDAGKTTACAVAVEADPSEADQRWLTRGAPHGRYIEAELLLKAWWHRDHVDASGVRIDADPITGLTPSALVNCRLLAIDDVGQEPAPFVAEVGEALDVLVRLRCDRRLRTVISTNLASAEAMIARYNAAGRGQRLAERITEHGRWVRCPVEGLRAPRRREQVLARREREART